MEPPYSRMSDQAHDTMNQYGHKWHEYVNSPDNRMSNDGKHILFLHSLRLKQLTLEFWTASKSRTTAGDYGVTSFTRHQMIQSFSQISGYKQLWFHCWITRSSVQHLKTHMVVIWFTKIYSILFFARSQSKKKIIFFCDISDVLEKCIILCFPPIMTDGRSTKNVYNL